MENLLTLKEMKDKYIYYPHKSVRNEKDRLNYNNMFELRDHYINKYGFVGLCKEFIDELYDLVKGKNILGVMSGTGYIEAYLKEKGASIKATDSGAYLNYIDFSWDKHIYTDVETIDASKAVDKYHDWADMVIMSWPPYSNNSAYKVAVECHKYNIPIIYLGENMTGCTADDSFFDYVYSNGDMEECTDDYFRFFGIYDNPYLITWSDSSETK